MALALDNDDMLTEILLRLPAKSLIRFKSVCKKWLSLISSDYFCHHHTLRRPKLQPSLILQHTGHFSHPDLFYLNPTINGEKVMMIPYTLSLPDHYKIVQACNGLLLLEDEDFFRSIYHFFRSIYHVYNPTTKQSREISLNYDEDDVCVAAMGLAFDPSKSPYYKIVCIMGCSAPDTYRVEVYDSESHSWKLSSEPFTFSTTSLFRSDAHYWNNAIYWSSSGCNVYCYFDIATNEMKTLSFLPNYRMHPYTICYSYLQESDGHLYHLKLLFKAEVKAGIRESVEVWELGGDGNSEWLLKDHHVITCEGLDERVSPIRLMGRSDGDETETTCNLLLLTYHEAGNIRAYSFLNKSYENLVDFTAPPFNYSDDDDVSLHSNDGEVYDVKGFQFGETLALV